MRIVRVWISAFAFMFAITVSWWLTLPVIVSVADAIEAAAPADVPEVTLLIDTVSYAASLWGPLLDLFILIWAFTESQRRDVESEIYT